MPHPELSERSAGTEREQSSARETVSRLVNEYEFSIPDVVGMLGSSPKSVEGWMDSGRDITLRPRSVERIEAAYAPIRVLEEELSLPQIRSVLDYRFEQSLNGLTLRELMLLAPASAPEHIHEHYREQALRVARGVVGHLRKRSS